MIRNQNEDSGKNLAPLYILLYIRTFTSFWAYVLPSYSWAVSFYIADVSENENSSQTNLDLSRLQFSAVRPEKSPGDFYLQNGIWYACHFSELNQMSQVFSE